MSTDDVQTNVTMLIKYKSLDSYNFTSLSAAVLWWAQWTRGITGDCNIDISGFSEYNNQKSARETYWDRCCWWNSPETLCIAVSDCHLLSTCTMAPRWTWCCPRNLAWWDCLHTRHIFFRRCFSRQTVIYEITINKLTEFAHITQITLHKMHCILLLKNLLVFAVLKSSFAGKSGPNLIFSSRCEPQKLHSIY